MLQRSCEQTQTSKATSDARKYDSSRLRTCDDNASALSLVYNRQPVLYACCHCGTVKTSSTASDRQSKFPSRCQPRTGKGSTGPVALTVRMESEDEKHMFHGGGASQLEPSRAYGSACYHCGATLLSIGGLIRSGPSSLVSFFSAN